MPISFLSIALLLCVCACGCRPAAPHATGRTTPADAAAALADPWITKYPGDYSGDFQQVDASRVAVVIEAKQEDALALLRDKAWTELSPDTASGYIGNRGEVASASGKIVLLRCVQTERPAAGEGSMDKLLVGWNAGKVHVVFSSTRNGYLPVRHVAVVAVLPSLPTDVFVDLRTAIW